MAKADRPDRKTRVRRRYRKVLVLAERGATEGERASARAQAQLMCERHKWLAEELKVGEGQAGEGQADGAEGSSGEPTGSAWEEPAWGSAPDPGPSVPPEPPPEAFEEWARQQEAAQRIFWELLPAVTAFGYGPLGDPGRVGAPGPGTYQSAQRAAGSWKPASPWGPPPRPFNPRKR